MALPDGAHLSEEDYSYFVRFPPSLSPTSAFSANRALQHCTFSPSNDNSQQHNAETNIPTNQTLFGISYVIFSFSLFFPLPPLPPSLSCSFYNVISSVQSSDICPFFSFFFIFDLLGAIANSPPPSSTVVPQMLPGAWSKKPSSSLPVTQSLYVPLSPFLLSFCSPKRLTALTGPDKRQARRRHPCLLRTARFRRNQAFGRLLYLS